MVIAILETHKKQTNISKIISSVQTARRFHAAQYQKHLNTNDDATNDEDVGGEGERPRVDVQTISEIETRVNQIRNLWKFILTHLHSYSIENRFLYSYKYLRLGKPMVNWKSDQMSSISNAMADKIKMHF